MVEIGYHWLMRILNHLKTWLLVLLMVAMTSGVANGKSASGSINLAANLYQGIDVSKSLNALGIAEVSTTHALDSPLVPKKGDGTNKSELLPNEGRVGTYGDLVKQGVKGDDLTPHHMPADSFMKHHGVKRKDGVAMDVEQPTPGTGGRHRRTRTYGRGADLDETPREALARDIKDARKVYREDDVYTPEIHDSLKEVIKQNKDSHPDLFNK